MTSEEDILPIKVIQKIIINKSKILGQGGYGTVFEGTWGNEKFAVKRILLEKIDNDNKEERALQKLNHPNVIKLYHVESDKNYK